MPKTTKELYEELLAQGAAAQQQADDLLKQYDNRPAFAYDPNTDGTYQALKNQYVHQGRRAMEDTIGQAAGLTGGYNSSYGQSVGNQAYNEYLTQLNAQIPGLAREARSAWDAEGDRMLQRYNLALNAANTAYGQGRDALSDMRYEQEWEQQQRAYDDDLAYRQWQQQQAGLDRERQTQLDEADRQYREWQMANSDKEDAYSRAMTWIKMGIMPSDEALAAAGIDKAQAQQAVYLANAGGYSGGGGSSGGRRSSGGGRSYSGRSSGGQNSSDSDKGNQGNGDSAQSGGDFLVGPFASRAAYNKIMQEIVRSNMTGNTQYAYDAFEKYSSYVDEGQAADLMQAFEKYLGKFDQGNKNKQNKTSNRKPSGPAGNRWVRETK